MAAKFEDIYGSIMDPTLRATTTADGLMSYQDKVKLDGIATGATSYVHPDTHPASMITQDSTHRFVTDTEKNTWNAKASTAVATQSTNGLMSAADKLKLDGIADGAGDYVHPATHPATMITEDSSHRFVTDTEKSTWNAKANNTLATQSANGLMSSTDKTKLDGIASGATKVTVDSALSSTSTNPVQNKVINTALAGKAASSHTHTGTQVTGLTASMALVSNSSGQVTTSAVTATELGYLDGVTSAIQTQLNGKAASSHTHSGTQVTGLTASRALVSNSSGQVAVASVTSTELGYLDGVTSAIQTQLNGKAASSHTHNYAGSSSAGGSANSAVQLANARTINGTSFNGTANITTANWGTARTLTIGNSAKSVNGSDNVTWTHNEIGTTKIVSSLDLGGTNTGITTEEFIEILTEENAFSYTHWICRGTWSYASNSYITDTGFGNVHLAGTVVELFKSSNSAYTIRLTTPTTAPSGSTPNLDLIYINNGDAYNPGWRKLYNNKSLPTPSELGAAASSHTHSGTQVTGLTASRALVSNSSGQVAVANVTSTELGYLDGVTSAIQTQLNGKAASSHTHSGTQVTGLTASRALVSNSSGQVAVASVTSTELGYLDGVTSNIQTQLNRKAASSHTHNYAAASHTHTGTQVTGLTASRALVSNRSGQVAVANVTSTELGYLDGVTSAIQTQLNSITSRLSTLETNYKSMLAKLKTAVFIKQ